jgi:hypothetical protein
MTREIDIAPRHMNAIPALNCMFVRIRSFVEDVGVDARCHALAVDTARYRSWDSRLWQVIDTMGSFDVCEN